MILSLFRLYFFLCYRPVLTVKKKTDARAPFFLTSGPLIITYFLRLSLSWTHTVKVYNTKETQNSIAHVSTFVQSCERSCFSVTCGTDRSLVLRLTAQWELVPSSGSRHGSCSALKWLASACFTVSYNLRICAYSFNTYNQSTLSLQFPISNSLSNIHVMVQKYHNKCNDT